MSRLEHLDLSGNNLTREIPLSGALPSSSIASLEHFIVSCNRLNGSIPTSLHRFRRSFVGNLNLWGRPFPPGSPVFPSLAPSPRSPSNKRKLSEVGIILIPIGAFVILIVVLLLLLACCWLFRRQHRLDEARAQLVPSTDRSGDLRGSEAEGGQLVFRGNDFNFRPEDLRQPSAEVLGKGSLGISYKLTREGHTTMVVKRLEGVTVSPEEFSDQMKILEQAPPIANLLPLRGYYHSMAEQFLFFNFLPAGTLASLLHGKRESGETPLDWGNRKLIAIGAARGLSALHTEALIIHGNVKASNVLVLPGLDAALLCDFGLHSVFGIRAPPNREAGYCAPEVLATWWPTFQSDVYSFGVLLLELLTGKAPNRASLDGQAMELPRWVQSVKRRGNWTAEVFDADLPRHENTEKAMMRLLEVALDCVSTVPHDRPNISDVVRMMEEISDGCRPPSPLIDGSDSSDD